MKLSLIFLLFGIKSEFGDCLQCKFIDFPSYSCEIYFEPSNICEQHAEGKTDNDIYDTISKLISDRTCFFPKDLLTFLILMQTGLGIVRFISSCIG